MVLSSSQTAYLTTRPVCHQGLEKSVHGCQRRVQVGQREARREVRSEGKWRPEKA